MENSFCAEGRKSVHIPVRLWAVCLWRCGTCRLTVTGCELALLSQLWNWCSSLSSTELSSHCVSVSRWTAGGSAASSPENYTHTNAGQVLLIDPRTRGFRGRSPLITHLQLAVGVQISICEGEQRLQYHLLSQGAISVRRRGRAVQGEQQTPSDYKALWEDVGNLVEGLANAAVVIVEQPAVKLREGAELRG